jgi:murein DD-endopeptidase MepM/ murein hydrolase activator NlpD
MVEQTGSLVRRAFAERHIEIRSKGRVRQITLSRSWQVVGLLTALVLVAGTVRLAAGYVNAHRRMAHKEAEVVKAEASKNDLNSLVDQLRQRLIQADRDMAQVRERLADIAAQNAALRTDLFATDTRLRQIDRTRSELTAERDEAQEKLKSAESALSAKSNELAHMGRGLDSTKTDLAETEQERAELGDRLHKLEGELEDATNQSVQYKTSWEAAQRKLEALADEREKVVSERDGLLGRLAALQQPLQERGKLSKQAVAELSRAVAAVRPTLSPPSANPASANPPSAGTAVAAASSAPTSLGGFIADEGRLGWSEVTSLLASTGVDMDKLAARFGAAPSGQGGPFVALGGINLRKGDAEALQKALKTLPLSAPLAHYQLESRFGPRTDPFNRRASFHPGLDLSAPFKSPVFNTAPGVVVFAGPRSDYGKVVEIDHGSGIVTRYAHLHRITVALGQHLGAREQIGLLGSTGRSSGPHVHYEVVVNGTPQDPEKFLAAGRSIVQVSQQQ